MINKKFLLNTYRFGNEARLVSAHVSKIEDCHLDIGSPCIVDSNIYNRVRDDDYIPVLFTFNYDTGRSPNYISSAKKKDIIIKSSKCIADNIMKQIDVFDFNKVKSVSEYVKKHGSILFSLFTQNPHSAAKATNKSAIKFINGMYDNIVNRYSYHSVSHVSYSKNCPTILGDLRYVIHFISIPNCLSILNRYKVDGVGLIFNIISISETFKKKCANTIFSISIILSNFKENIFVIDGINIREQTKLKDKYVFDAISIIKKNLEQNEEFSIFQRKKKPEENPNRTIEEPNDLFLKEYISSFDSATTNANCTPGSYSSDYGIVSGSNFYTNQR